MPTKIITHDLIQDEEIEDLFDQICDDAGFLNGFRITHLANEAWGHCDHGSFVVVFAHTDYSNVECLHTGVYLGQAIVGVLVQHRNWLPYVCQIDGDKFEEVCVFMGPRDVIITYLQMLRVGGA